MRRVVSVALGLIVASATTVARAEGEDDEEEETTDEEEPSSDDESSEEEPADEDAGKVKEKPSKAGDQQSADFKKQDLTGHAMGTEKKSNEFERDRFFVDKTDTKKTEKGTLVQGSIASSSFFYTESGGDYGAGLGSNAGKFSRYFTDLRLQTDFRHISASRWDARIDARARMVNTPDDKTGAPSSQDANRIQSGFNGTNEYEIRELWIIRNGKRSDVILGRQFIPDLGALKIDGLRIDYASSRTLTFLGFAGLYPIRGSRSLTTDYLPLKDAQGNDAGKLVGAGGFGAAYRTVNTYGSLGGVALVPTAAEQPRFYVTSNGYYRAGPQLDVYHFGLIDLVGAGGFRLTNLSAGVNYKPNQRLRLTGAFNRVDTDTLNVQARAFLDPADPMAAAQPVQNETFIQRLSTNQARAGVSAGLGAQQRFELSTAFTFRYRPDVTISSPNGMNSTTLKAAKGVDLYVSLTDRRSFKDARIGVDASRTFAIGAIPYQRTEVLALRTFVAREISNGRGEWEAEVSYATTKDIGAGATCVSIDTCFGSTTNTILSVGGNLYYRINRNWFGLASAALSRQATQVLQGGVTVTDPGIVGFTGFGRIAYRF
ncbi:MAG: hypothetical protein H0T79_12605 [Deltaproteobacteria bacterium]|nr:hypothetical protein [Deltaproteobacteria bacterium]